MYDTLGQDACRFIVDQTKMTTIVLENNCFAKMCQLKIDDASNPDQKMQRLETIIAFEAISEEDKAIAAKAGIKCYSMEEVIFKGREAAKQSTPTFYDAKPDHCYVFSYTSGTTGDPKGVKISHQMMLG